MMINLGTRNNFAVRSENLLYKSYNKTKLGGINYMKHTMNTNKRNKTKMKLKNDEFS